MNPSFTNDPVNKRVGCGIPQIADDGTNNINKINEFKSTTSLIV